MSTSSESHTKEKRRRKELPARTPEGRINQLVNLAVDVAEKKLIDGTASSQIIVTLLQLGTAKAKLELERMKSDLELSGAKIKHMEMQETSQKVFEEAIAAFKGYQGGFGYDERYCEEDDVY